MDLRAFVYGIMIGIAILIGSLAFASYLAGVKWEPVKVSTLTSDHQPK